MSILQRKAQVGKQEHQARAMTVPKALRVGLAKVADEGFDMALAVIGVTHDVLSVEQALENVTDEMLAITLDGLGGFGGGAVITHELVSAMVQQQTTGRVATIPDFDRAMTATDAALCAPLIDRLFARAHGLLETTEDREVLPCFKFGARAENTRLFGLSLEDPEYTVFRLTIDISGGIAQACMVLILPLPSAKPELSYDEDGAQTVVSNMTLEASVMELKAELSAVLCRLRLPLSDVRTFEVGQELSVTTEAFGVVQLVSITGEVVTTGALGQLEGHRALMLHRAIDDETESPPTDAGAEAFPEAGSDYSDLALPELELPVGEAPIDPSTLDGLTDLPALEGPDDIDLPDLPDLPDLTDAEGLPDLSDLPDIADGEDTLSSPADLPKINVA